MNKPQEVLEALQEEFPAITIHLGPPGSIRLGCHRFLVASECIVCYSSNSTAPTAMHFGVKNPLQLLRRLLMEHLEEMV